MAYAGVEGTPFPPLALEELQGNPDRAIALWASFVRTQEETTKEAGLEELKAACQGTGWEQELACILFRATRLEGRPDAQKQQLDRATAWLRLHHPESQAIWSQSGLNPAERRSSLRGERQ